MRGDGRVFRKPGTRFWHMAYYVDGREVSESTKETDEDRARRALRRRLDKINSAEESPHDHRVTLGNVPARGCELTEREATETLIGLLLTDYAVNRRRSLPTVPYPLRHLVEHFGEHAKAVRITDARVKHYVRQRQRQKAATASINMELALLRRAFRLAIKAKRLGVRQTPDFDRLAPDESRVRRGFFTREDVDRLCAPCNCLPGTRRRVRSTTAGTRCWHLPEVLGDVVRFLFWSAWRVGEVRTLEWRDYDRREQVIRLRPEHSKSRYERVLPIEGELVAVMERRLETRRSLRGLECPFIFHRNGKRVGDFRKAWSAACTGIGLAGRIVHDLRRSGVKHLIDAGVDPHTVMAFSGHRTDSMLKRYHIIDMHDLRRAALRASAYAGTPGRVELLRNRAEDATAEVAADADRTPTVAPIPARG